MANRAPIYNIDPRRKAGSWLFLAFAAAFFVTMIAITYIQAIQSGRGTGFGDGYLQPSLKTPGGPYYPSGR